MKRRGKVMKRVAGDVKRNNKIAFATDIKNLLIRDSPQIERSLTRQRENGLTYRVRSQGLGRKSS